MRADELRAIGVYEPSGAMTTGYSIARHRHEPHTVVETWPREPSNSILVASYFAIGCGLKAYQVLGGSGPLTLVVADPMVVRQLQDDAAIREPFVVRLRARIRAYEQRTPVRVVYDPATAIPGLTASTSLPIPDERRVIRDPEVLLAPPLAAAIQRLNQHARPDAVGLAALRVGGADMLSDMRLDRLQWRLTQIAREQAADIIAWVARTLPTPQHQATALRWVLRGLAVEIAVRKVQADLDATRQPGRRPVSGTLAAAS